MLLNVIFDKIDIMSSLINNENLLIMGSSDFRGDLEIWAIGIPPHGSELPKSSTQGQNTGN